MKHGVKFETTIGQDLPSISGNAHQLEIALANIIRNAGDAMQMMTVGERVLRCDLQNVPGFLEVKITDSGPGISAKDRSRLFDPWFSTKGSHGMGIGLYLTHEIIRRHEGEIEVTSEEGRGSTFRITIPSAIQ